MHIKKLLFVFVFFVLSVSSLVFATSVCATTYYINATGGSDSYNGTSTSTPWQTIDKVNAATFLSGDSVLFKRGETWTFDNSNDRLVTQSGVTYADYGSGDKPIIDGNHVSDGMLGLGVSNVTVENMVFTNCYDACAQFIQTNNVSVKDCEMSGAGNDNLLFITDNNNVTVSGGKYYNPVRRVAGTQVTNIELADGGSNFNIDGVELYGAENAGISIHNHTGTEVPTGITINNIYSHDNTGNGIQILTQDQTQAVDIDITNSRFISNNTGIRVFMSGSYYVHGDVLVDKNIFGSNSIYGFFIQGDDVTIQRSIFYGTNQAGQVTSAKNLTFRNNTTYLSPSSAIWMFYVSGGARVDGIVVKNNIFFMTTTSGQFIGSAASSSTNMDVDYNQYYFSPYLGNARWMKDGTAYTFANWQGTVGFDTHGLGPTSNPSFVNAGSQDFRLQSGSPSINAGVDVGLSYSGSSPDIGAYEYAPANPPSSLSQSVSGNNLTFTFNMSSLDPTDTLTPAIEIQPWDMAFTNIPNYYGSAVSYSGSSITGTVSVSNFGSGSFHWQAVIGNYVGNSSWVSYGSNNSIDFSISFPPSGVAPCSNSVPKFIPWVYSAKSRDAISVLLTFAKAIDASEIFIEYGTQEGSYPYATSSLSSNLTNYLIKSLSPDKTYYFRIRAGNGCATGEWSNVASATTKKIAYKPSGSDQELNTMLAPKTEDSNLSAGEVVAKEPKKLLFFGRIDNFFRELFSKLRSFFTDRKFRRVGGFYKIFSNNIIIHS